jgi:GAF domain-containing protein
MELLLNKQAISGPVSELPPEERPFLEAQDIQSVIVVPIVHEGIVWDLIGVDDCKRARHFDAAEATALTHAANLLGEALTAVAKTSDV